MKHLLIFSLLLTLAITGSFSIDTFAQDDAGAVITAENVHDLVELERFGYGTRDAVAWTADESVLAVGGSLGVWLYDGQNLEAEPRFLPNSRNKVHHLAFNDDGTQIAIGWGEDHVQGLVVLDVETGDIVLELDDAVSGDPGVQFSADGAVFVAQTQRGTVVWDMVDMVERYVLPNHAAVALSSDGNWIAAIVSRLDMVVYDLQKGDSRVFTPSNFQEGGIMGPALGLVSLAFTEYEGQMVVATLHEERDHVDWLLVMRFWDIAIGTPIVQFNVGTGYAPDYEHEPISDDGIALRDVIDWKSVVRFHTGRASAVALPQALLQFNPTYLVSNGETLVVSQTYASRLDIWSLATGDRITELVGEGGSIHALTMRLDGEIIVAGMDEFLNIWRLNAQGDYEATIVDTGHSSIITELIVSEDASQITTFSYRETFEWTWDVESGNPPRLQNRIVRDGDPLFVNQIIPSSDFSIRAHQIADGIHIVDVASDTEIYHLDESDMFVRRLAFTPDTSRLLGIAGTYDDTSGTIGNRDFLGYIVAWDVQTGEYLGQLSDPSIQLDEFAVSPDGSIVAVSGSRFEDGSAILDAATGEVLLRLDATGVPIFSPDGSRLYFVDTGVIDVFGLPERD